MEGKWAAHGHPRYYGYKFSDSTPLFKFGFGLSYTTYTAANLRLNTTQLAHGAKDRFLVTVKVTNNSTMDGDAVVHVYIQDPIDGVVRYWPRLIGFERVHIPAGASTVSVACIKQAQSVIAAGILTLLSCLLGRRHRRAHGGAETVLV